MQIQMIAIDEIIPYARNPRRNKPAVTKVAASIKEFGFRQPIVVDSEMVVIVGHTRLLAAKKLKMKTVPVHVAEGLTASQIKAYRLADNRTSEEAEWDDELLGLELSDLHLDSDFELGLTGFDVDELEKYLNIDFASAGEPAIDDSLDNYKQQYGVIVVCDSEAQQEEIFTQLSDQGFNCKVVVT